MRRHQRPTTKRIVAGAIWSLMAISLLTIMPQFAGAQVLYGSLVGRIEDPSGAVVPGARVSVVNKATGQERETVADDSGSYAFRDLQVGIYDLKVAQGGFKSYTKAGLNIGLNNIVREDVRMEVGQASETVTITAEAPALQTDRADVSSQLDKSQVTNLPIGAGRNFQQLYKLIPGAAPPADAHSDAGNPQRALVTNFNGVSFSNNNTRLDGATVSYPWLPHIVAYVPPQDAVETVNIVTNSFDAEQGMAGGAAVNVQIKSGTNQFHGTAHEFHTNSAMRARNYFFYGPQLPKNIFNQFGGTFGGPVVKNKLFFFSSWERTVRRQNASAFRTLPTAALRSGDFSGTGARIYDPSTGNADGSGRQLFANDRIPTNRIDPIAAKMIALIPNPNLVTATPANNYFASGTYEFDRDNYDFKVNYNPSEKTTMFVRYSISPSQIFDPPSLGAAGGDALAGGQPGNAPGRVQSTAIGGTYTISSHLLVDGNIGFTRQRLGAQNVDIDKNYGLDDLGIPGTNGPDKLQGGYPRFTISGFSSIGNPNVSNPFLFRDNQYVAAGNLSWLRGAHSLRFGGEYTYYTINHFQPQAAFGPRGGFNFSGGLTSLRGGAAPTLYNGWADFLLGLPQSMGKDLQNINPAAVRMPGWGIYARDQWQVTRNLTVNFGTRYEYYPFATRDHRGAERYDPISDKVLIGGLGGVPENTGVDVGKGQLAPRLGIAWRATEKTVLRVGYGISVDPNSFRNMRDAYPATISLQISGPTTFQAAGALKTGLPAIVSPDLTPGTISLPTNIGTQTFPQVFNRGYIQSFNLTLQRDIGWGFTAQAAYVGSRAIRQTANVNINAGDVGGGNAGRALAKFGRIANINMLVPFNTTTYDSLQTQLTRRLSPGAQMGITYTFSTSIGYADNSDSGLTWHAVSQWARNRARTNFDRPHNLQIFGIYELPFGQGKRWASSGPAALLAGGWQFNAVMSKTSGTPFTVTSAATSLNAPGNTQTADQVKSEVRILGGIGRGASYFDPTAFAPVTAVRFGTVGRNSMRGPSVFNLDSSLFRNFKLTERFGLQFRAEVFNLTNTPAFNNPGANASAPTRNADGSIINTNGFGEITSAQGTERQFRFALKLSF
ncbi:MAG: TonB-dependent receptor [Blastocatellia bacterium]|nr:TonB-dependent receptor [Blastocatellia bacterium]